MTLAARLLLLIALALMPPLALGVWTSVEQRHDREAAVRAEAIAQSRDLQANMARLASGVHRLLVALAEAPSIRSADPTECTQYLKSVAGQFQEYSLLGVIATDGNIVCTSAGAVAGSYSYADRAYFQRAMHTGEFVSGNLVTGTSTSELSLHFAMPFKQADGRLGGAVLASVGQSWLERELAYNAMPPGAEAILLDPDGNIVASAQDGKPTLREWIGRQAPAALRQALNVRAPAAIETFGPDGVPRLYGALPLDPRLGGDLVAVGFDRDQAFADLRGASQRNLLGLLLGATVALIAGMMTARRFVLRPLERLAIAANRVGAGDLDARADLEQQSGEVRELGIVFNRMADALAARERDRENAEAALREGEKRLRAALEAGGLGAFEYDFKQRTVHAADGARAIFGFEPEAGRNAADYLDRVVPEDRGALRTSMGDGIRAGRVENRFRIRLPGGELRHVLCQGEVTAGPDGAPAMLVGLLSDETDRLAAESALRESEVRFQAIVDCIDQMVWSTLPDGNHDYFNQRWYDFTGTTEGSSDGERWRNLFHPDDQQTAQERWQLSLATGRPYHIEYRLRHVSGRYRWVLGRAQPVRDPEGRIVRWYGTCTDIDDIVQARDVLARSREVLTREVADRTAELMLSEEKLRQSQKMEAVGQLTGGIAHDFNNMLQAIGGALELLLRRVEQGKLDDAKRFAGVARKTVDRAAALTHRLLAFARRQTLQSEPTLPNTLVESMAELVAGTVGPAIAVSHRGGPSPWTVLCDPSQLENVLFNLCINARDAMPEGGRLSISTENVTVSAGDAEEYEGAAAGDYVEVAVVDSGAGMDQQTQARAFEPFFTTKPLGQGTGLGLSQVYGFVRQSGGFVRLDSEPGRGTTVRLFLPRYELPIADPAADTEPAVASPSRALSLLLVEDDRALRFETARHLRSLGFNVREADGGPTAILLLRPGAPRIDILVTEVGLPGNVNGRQIAEAAREHNPDVLVLFVTGYAGTDVEGELAPGMGVLPKPFAMETLYARVQAMTEATLPA